MTRTHEARETNPAGREPAGRRPLVDDATLRAVGLDLGAVARASVVDGSCSGARLVRLRVGRPSRTRFVVKLLAQKGESSRRAIH